MKKSLFLLVILSATLVLSACSSTQAASPVAGGGAGAGSPQAGSAQERSLSLAMKLALGTFKLEDTDHPITADQAQEMLPLWKALRSLSTDQTTAAEELQAVVKQIQEAMTPEQTAAIDAMKLTFQDMQAIAQERGLNLGGGGGFGNLSPEARATLQAGRQSGQGPQGGEFGGGPPPFGGAPGGGGGGGGQGGLSAEARQTAQARNGGFSNSGLGVPAPLLNAIITFLEGKAGVPTATPTP